MNSKRQKEGKFGHAVYKFTFTVCLRGHCTFIVVLVTRVPSKHLHLLRPCVLNKEDKIKEANTIR